MDCPAEERLVRMKLQDLAGIEDLRFDLGARLLEVRHRGAGEPITAALRTLGLGEVRVIEKGVSDAFSDGGSAGVSGPSDPPGEDTGARGRSGEKKALLAAFSINAFFFVTEFTAGLLASSLGLVADSLDMLADALVYALALGAVGEGLARQKKVTRLMGLFEGFLAVAGLAEAVRRFFHPGDLPDYRAMIGVSFAALLGNAATLLVLRRRQRAGIHMKAAWICTSNDVKVNLLVILSGFLVLAFDSPWPDLLVAIGIFAVVIRGTRRILGLAR